MLASVYLSMLENWMMQQTPNVLSFSIVGMFIVAIILYVFYCYKVDKKNQEAEKDIKRSEELSDELREEWERLRGE